VSLSFGNRYHRIIHGVTRYALCCRRQKCYWPFESERPTKYQKVNYGRSPAQAQDIVSCQFKSFLRTKRIVGSGKEKLKYSNWGYAYINGIVVLAEGLNVFRLGAIATGGNMTSQAICPLQKERRLDGYLGVEPKCMRLHWLKASVTTEGGIFLDRDHFSVVILLQLKKSTGKQSRSSSK
jgi:hypothetical protein